MSTFKLLSVILSSIALAACGGGGGGSAAGGGGSAAGGGSSAAGGGSGGQNVSGSSVTIASMPYNGSVSGTNHGYYTYTTTGATSLITMSALTADLDPQVYTDATFSTLNPNWTCTLNSGTISDSCTATTAEPAGTVLYIMARNWAGVGSTFTLEAGTATAAAVITLPYNGSVVGAASAYYRYDTVASRSLITLLNTGLTGDLDPKIYTDATFTTLSPDWTCTAGSGTTSDSCTATTAVPAGTALYIKVYNFLGVSASFTLQ